MEQRHRQVAGVVLVDLELLDEGPPDINTMKCDTRTGFGLPLVPDVKINM